MNIPRNLLTACFALIAVAAFAVQYPTSPSAASQPGASHTIAANHYAFAAATGSTAKPPGGPTGPELGPAGASEH